VTREEQRELQRQQTREQRKREREAWEAARGPLDLPFLLLVILIRRQRPDWDAVKSNLTLLLLSGTAIGFNWILLFEAYNYTSVATATLCYYLAPILVILAAPFVLKEKLTLDSMTELLAELDMSLEPVVSQMNIPDNAVVALDISLLYDDTPRIKQELPIISMALCKELSKKHPCYLYSGLTVSQTVINQWIKTYQEVFGASNIEVYSKEDLLTKRKDTNAKIALMEKMRTYKENTT